jgi:hypothetical protein
VPRGQRDRSLQPYSRFSRQEPLLFYQVARLHVTKSQASFTVGSFYEIVRVLLNSAAYIVSCLIVSDVEQTHEICF